MGTHLILLEGRVCHFPLNSRFWSSDRQFGNDSRQVNFKTSLHYRLARSRTEDLMLELFQQLRIEPQIDILLMLRNPVLLKSSYQLPQPRRQDDQISRTRSGLVCMRFARRNEHCLSRTHRLRSVIVAEMKFSLQNMPSFVIGVMHVENCGPTAQPFVETERPANRGKRF